MDVSAPAKWFRMYNEFATDPKVQMLSESDQRRYVMLLCLRCCNGDVTLHETEVAFQLRISDEEWAKTKAVLLSKNLITNDNKPTAWEKRQRASDSSAERVAKHRALHKKQGSGDVTLQKRTVETEKEKEKEKKTTSVSHEKIVFDGSSFQNVNGQLRVWQTAFPAIDVQSEINRAAAWVMANPKNRKSNYDRFLTNWMSRAQDKAPPKGGGSPAQSGLLAGAL